MMPGPEGLELHVGDLGELRDEWRVGDKRLYEIGLPGRYNDLGQWKPVVYPGKSQPLQDLARAYSDDPEVQGAYFYMLATGHRIIEFVVRSTIALPTKALTIGGRLHLWKCDTPRYTNVVLYDGWLDLERVDPEYIRSAIATIGVGRRRDTYGR
jgi:hypothetical protein